MASFKGMWISAGLLSVKSLSPNEKLIIAYCSSFKGKCFASNRHISEMVGIPEKTVRNTLTALRKRGIIKGRTFPGQDAVFSMSQIGAPLSQIGASECPKSGHIDIR